MAISCLHGLTRAALALLAVFLVTSSGSLALAQDTPIGPKCWPSVWGPEDQRGAGNRITAKKVLQAVSLIREGKIYQLGRLYEHGMPNPGKRHYSLTIPGLPTYAPAGKNMIVGNDEMVSAEIGQVGTQFDGLGHVGVRVGNDDVFYNGNKLADFGDTYGLKKLGIENAGVFFTRGVLLDVAAYKGVERLQPGYVITVADIEGTLEKQKIAIEEGDVVMFHTGHGKLWMKDNQTYGAGEPGPGVTAIKWLLEKKPAMTAADNWATEAVPGEDKDRPFEGHQHLLVCNGVYNHENLDLEQLAKDKVYEFAYIYAPLRLKGATGSPGNPIAVR
jgi:kynurenine formamidase